MNKHGTGDLKQMQLLPLSAKIAMTQKRIEAWYEAWKKYEIYNEKTGETRYVTATEEPSLKDNEYIESVVDGQVYVSFSGGKDSTVLKHIVDSMYLDVPAVFVNTGLEYPEIQKFVRDVKDGKFSCFNPDVEIVRPEMSFVEVIVKYGYPVIGKEVAGAIHDVSVQSRTQNVDVRETRLYDRYFNPESEKNKRYPGFCLSRYDYLFDAPYRISDECCNVMKKKPSKRYEKETGRKLIVGTLASESRLRRSNWLKNGCNSFDGKKASSQPLSFWTEQDILEYIKQYNVPYCPVYGEIELTDKGLKTTGCDRTGCVFCAFGVQRDGDKNRFQRLKETHPRQYEYCINGGEMVDGKWQPSKEGLGLGKVLDYIGVRYD